MGEEQGHKLGIVTVLLAGAFAQLVGVEEELRPPRRLVAVGGLLAALAVVALELLLAVAVIGAGTLGAPRSACSSACSSA